MKFVSTNVGSFVFSRRGRSPYRWVVLGMLLLAASFAFAQEATIVGTVTDPSGSVLPNVGITLVNTDTGQTRNVNSNEAGQYVAPGLRIGHYNVKAQATGFSVAERNGIVLNVGDRLRVDFEMKVGTTQEHITVEAAAVAVQSDSGEISNVITGKQITQLSTNGRSIYALVNLTPGASSLQGDFQTPTPVGGDANVSFNGSRPGHNIYLLDGGENLDRGGAGTFSVMPSLESLAEFRTLTSNYSAEYGLSSAATMTTVLKSGTKQFHASAWWFGRNDALDARNYFNRAPAPVAELRFNTWGFNVGGQIPAWKSHPTFFFYNMEWRRLIQGQTLNQTVPLTSTYGGDFSGAGLSLANLHAPYECQLSPGLQQAFADAEQALSGCTDGAPDATLQVPFNGNQIPVSLLDANAQALLNANIFPAPTNGSKFQGGNNSPTSVKEEIVRIDHTFSDKFNVFGHFIAEQISQGFGTTMWSGDNVPTIGNTFGNPSYSAVVHATHTISPSLLNEIAFNYNGNRINIIPKSSFGAPLAAPDDFTFNRVYTGPNESNRIPTINLSQATGAQYSANWTPWRNKADDYQIRDDISWVKGAHQLKFGFSWALYKKVQDVFASTQGNFGFNGVYTGNDFADFLLGYANSYAEDAVHDNGFWNNVSWAAYAQDNWRVTNRLTLNLGLRWDGVPHTYEANHRTSNFYPNLYNPADAPIFNPDGTISSSSPGLGSSPNPILAGYQFYLNGIGIDGLNGIPKGLVNNHWGVFGPRIGFAYDLTGQGKTVIRGGFGTMYERIQGNDMYNAGTNVPFSASAGFNNVLLSNPKTGVLTGTTISVPPLPIVVSDITGLNADGYKLPTTYQYSIGVQQSLAARTVLSVSYVGTQNRHQSDFRQVNLPDPSLLPGLVSDASNYNSVVPYLGFRSIRLAQNEANSHYNSLQVDLRGNVRPDLTLQFGYTLSRSIDPVAGNSNGYDLNNVSNPYEGWRYDLGPSFFDRTHVAFVNFVYDLPIFRGNQSRLLKATLGGWQLSGVVSMQSGAPLNITLGGNNVASVVPQTTNRPNLDGAISYPKKYVDNGDGSFGFQWFDPSVFSTPDAGTWGNLGHNALRGPGRDNWNLSLFKSFEFTERARLELRVESFNTWNHTQFRGDVQGGGLSSTFGASDFGQVTSAYDPRVFQLGAKLIF
ncbi:MAG: TonB-dependent receptor [Acidobacteria bacterium]|nr:TonB-dependent receptor [Acidobacteriota bacterium]